MAEFRLTAEARTDFGKGAARRTRRAGRIPAVLYGHGQEVIHLALPTLEFAAVMRSVGSNALVNVVLDGREQLALTRAVQRNPVNREFEHVDLLIVRQGERVVVDVPVTVVGQPGPDTIVNLELQTVSVEADATRLPNHIEVDVTGRTAGRNFTAADLSLPAGATILTDAEEVVVGFLGAPSTAQLEAELEAAETEAGIEREESAEAAEGAGQGDVVAEPQDQGSGESMESAGNS